MYSITFTNLRTENQFTVFCAISTTNNLIHKLTDFYVINYDCLSCTVKDSLGSAEPNLILIKTA